MAHVKRIIANQQRAISSMVEESKTKTYQAASLDADSDSDTDINLDLYDISISRLPSRKKTNELAQYEEEPKFVRGVEDI